MPRELPTASADRVSRPTEAQALALSPEEDYPMTTRARPTSLPTLLDLSRGELETVAGQPALARQHQLAVEAVEQGQRERPPRPAPPKVAIRCRPLQVQPAEIEQAAADLADAFRRPRQAAPDPADLVERATVETYLCLSWSSRPDRPQPGAAALVLRALDEPHHV